MKYIIQDDIALRSWAGAPFAYYQKGNTDAFLLEKKEFELLRKCDGKTDIEDSILLRQVIGKGLVRCSGYEHEELTDWQRLHVYTNRYMPKMNLEITGRCNCRCRHCFNAPTDASDELTYEEIMQLVDNAYACGVNAFTITGGEPLLFERLGEVFEAIYARGMFVFEINTNAMLLTQSFLDCLRNLGAEPLFKISFDGVGYHDWMRGVEGAEKLLPEKIKLCIRNGFRVCAQVNVNKMNICTMPETLDFLESLGVNDTRIIRTSESPKWQSSSKGLALDIGEYYDHMLELAVQYMSGSHRMHVNIWQFLQLYPDSGTYCIQPITAFGPGGFSEKSYLCPGARSMIAVGANGEVFPCMQVSGALKASGISYGNIRGSSLHTLLTDSSYLRCICTTVGEKLEKNATCRECPHISLCRGGCPALAFVRLGQTDGHMDPDIWKCIFFKQNYPEKCRSALAAFTNIDLGARYDG